MTKAAKSLFDPKLFLAKVGEGKIILKFDRNQVVFSQGEAANTVFYIQKGRIKVLVVSEQGKEAVVGILKARTILWRRMPQWPSHADFDNDGDGRMPDHVDHERRDVAAVLAGFVGRSDETWTNGVRRTTESPTQRSMEDRALS